MEGSERVRAALAMEPLDGRDRPPAAWWAHTYVEEWSPASLARVTLERQRRFGWDFVKVQPRATCFAEAFGSTYRPSGRPDRASKPPNAAPYPVSRLPCKRGRLLGLRDSRLQPVGP